MVKKRIEIIIEAPSGSGLTAEVAKEILIQNFPHWKIIYAQDFLIDFECQWKGVQSSGDVKTKDDIEAYEYKYYARIDMKQANELGKDGWELVIDSNNQIDIHSAANLYKGVIKFRRRLVEKYEPIAEVDEENDQPETASKENIE